MAAVSTWRTDSLLVGLDSSGAAYAASRAPATRLAGQPGFRCLSSVPSDAHRIDRDGDSRGGHGLGVLGVDRGQHDVEQAGEPDVEVVAAHGQPALGALGAGPGHAGLAQHPQVLGQGGLGHGDVEPATQCLAVRLELAQHGEPGRVAQRVQHADQCDVLAHGLIKVGMHANHLRTAGDFGAYRTG